MIFTAMGQVKSNEDLLTSLTLVIMPQIFCGPNHFTLNKEGKR